MTLDRLKGVRAGGHASCQTQPVCTLMTPELMTTHLLRCAQSLMMSVCPLQSTFLYGSLLRQLAHQSVQDMLGLSPGSRAMDPASEAAAAVLAAAVAQLRQSAGVYDYLSKQVLPALFLTIKGDRSVCCAGDTNCYWSGLTAAALVGVVWEYFLCSVRRTARAGQRQQLFAPSHCRIILYVASQTRLHGVACALAERRSTNSCFSSVQSVCCAVCLLHLLFCVQAWGVDSRAVPCDVPDGPGRGCSSHSIQGRA